MRLINTYVTVNFIRTFFIVLFVISTLAWLTQIIDDLTLILDRDRSIADFFSLTILLYPYIVSIIAPSSVLIASIIVMDRMTRDSEIVILNASGISVIQKISPFLVATIFITLLIYILSIHVSPMAMKDFREKINEIKSDIISSSFKKNEFSSPDGDYTIYVSDISDNNDFLGIIIKDMKSSDVIITYTAKVARIIDVEDQIILEMENGKIYSENLNLSDKETSAIVFEEYKINLSNIFKAVDSSYFKASEKSLRELFNVSNISSGEDRAKRIEYMNEAHMRISNPLYAIAFLFISLFFLQKDLNFRSIKSSDIIVVAICSFLVKLCGLVLSNKIMVYELYFLHYIIPLFIICAY
ncbi:MAG: LptF/LptG family permease, partial [Pseudomonadota bacterium]|nr:LptF/LptG family permease [Pseudomonadota bacterium]